MPKRDIAKDGGQVPQHICRILPGSRLGPQLCVTVYAETQTQTKTQSQVQTEVQTQTQMHAGTVCGM
eukprot:8873329-Alexandrium_andersonii.AAC.1